MAASLHFVDMRATLPIRYLAREHQPPRVTRGFAGDSHNGKD